MGREKRKIDPFINMSPVDKILVYCVKDELLGRKKKAIAHFLKEPIDWSNLVLQSGSHGVNAYVYNTLKKVNGNLVSPDALQKLRNSYLVENSKTVNFSVELQKILLEFQKREIKNILLKGPFLAEQIYPRSDLRSYTDIDILVQEPDLFQATELLSNLGYIQNEKNERLYTNEGRTQLLFQKPNSVMIDLHWEVLNNKWYPNVSKYFAHDIWKNIYPLKLSNSATWAFPREDLLIYQCIHLAIHHKFHKLVWFKDVDQILRSGPIDWATFLTKVKKYRLVTHCYYALNLTKILLESPIPESILYDLRPRFFMARVFEFFLRRENLLRLSENRRSQTQQIWRILRDDFWQRWGAVRWRAFPSIEWYLCYYPFLPRIKEVYYYPLYPFLILLRLVRRP